MRSPLIFILLFCSFISFGQIKEHVYQEGSLHELLENIEDDENLQFERMIAYHFHQLINKYRTSKNKKTLYWDDRLWLAARNHNLYMIQNDILDHSESKHKTGFTGSSPLDRANFVTYGDLGTNAWGENCLYNYSGSQTEDDLAKHIAESSFEQWKKSSGHNKNMLSSDYFAHGTAFNIGDATWATTVFIAKPNDYSENEIDIAWANKSKELHLGQTPTNGIPYEPYKWNNERQEFKFNFALALYYRGSEIQNIKGATISSFHHLNYQINENRIDDIENKDSPYYYGESSKKRFKKASGFTDSFKTIKYNIVEQSFNLQLTEEEVENNSAMLIFENKLDSELGISGSIKGIDYWGGNVRLIENSGSYTCWIDVVYLIKKKS